ncbi:MAG: class I SAM-dependent methyltransferase [Acidimicrobiia bacterium]
MQLRCADALRLRTQLAEVPLPGGRGPDRHRRRLAGPARPAGKRFVDVGSGSGLFSLVARRAGAEVHSFDVDEDSVWCTAQLRDRYFEGDPGWVVELGSALDRDYLKTLGTFDVVYSFGVLHHTGALWEAMGNVVELVAPGGSLALGIYNDQGTASRGWGKVKALYNARAPLRPVLLLGAGGYLWGRHLLARLLLGRRSDRRRGMSAWRDLVDWVGGYPFEVAKPELVFRFLRDRDFELVELQTCAGGHGCNTFVARLRPSPPAD